MKKTVKVEGTYCDVCGASAYPSSACVVCGKDYCWECIKNHAVQYHAYVFASGHGDATYCMECDAKASGEKYSAYVQLENLRREYRAFTADFDARKKAAEERIKKFI